MTLAQRKASALRLLADKAEYWASTSKPEYTLNEEEWKETLAERRYIIRTCVGILKEKE